MLLSRVILAACLKAFGVLSLIVAVLSAALVVKSLVLDGNSAVAVTAAGLAMAFIAAGLGARWLARRTEPKG